MDKRQVHELLRRYVRGECDDAEQRKIHQWYDRLYKGDDIRLSEEEKMLLEDKLWNNIRTDLQAEELFPETKNRKPMLSWLYTGAAAMLLMGVGLAWNLYRTEKREEQPDTVSMEVPRRIKKMNDGNEPVKVLLGDGSKVTLLPGSTLDYPGRFQSEKREVILTGDAFFEIAPDPGHPFLVHNGKLVTQVLGTSFWIRTHQKNKSLEVEVVSGKVSVFENIREDKNTENTLHKTQSGVVLTPNQRVTYYPENGHLLTGVVEVPVAIQAPASIEMVFDNDKIRDIAPLLFKKFGIEIVLSHEGLEECTFTGDVNGLALYEALELVCKSVGARYETKGTRILISGIGCD